MNKQCLLALDVGGSSIRMALTAMNGDLLANAQCHISTQYPGPGLVEHQPQEIQKLCKQLLEECINTAGSDYFISDLGLSTQRSTLVCWNKSTNECYGNIISWQDVRGRRMLETVLKSVGQQQIRRISGLYPSAHYGASKICCLLEGIQKGDHGAEASVALANKKLLVTPLASWVLSVISSLLGQKVQNAMIDVGQAQRTLLWDITSNSWHATLLQKFNISRDVLPQVHNNIALAFKGTGSPDRTVVMTGDQCAALFANGWPDYDNLYLNAGTGAFLLQPLTEEQVRSIPETILHSIVYRDGSSTLHAAEATMNGCGSALTWLDRQHACNVDKRPAYNQLQAENKQWVGVFINTVGGLAAPWWRTDIPPEFIDCDNMQQQYFAVYESILFLVKYNFEFMHKSLPDTTNTRQVIFSGGLSQDESYCQALSDLLDLTVKRRVNHEASLSGVRWLLLNMDRDMQTVSPDCQHVPDQDQVFSPAPNKDLCARYQKWCMEMNARV